MPKISIIVPVFNTEKYLNQCLDSLINQTLADIEIICVDDGSTDNSLEILQDYASRDSRIKVYSQKNQGVSVARNFGISKAQGEFLTFLDSDDWLDINMCDKLYNYISQTNVDIMLFSFFNCYNDTANIDDRIKIIKNNILEDIFYFNDEVTNIIPNVPYETCGKLYRTSFLRKYNIVFPEKIRLAEDCCFFINACINNSQIMILNEALYYYRKYSSNSLVKKSEPIKQLHLVLLYIKNLIKNSNLKKPTELYYYFFTRFVTTVLTYWNSCHASDSKKSNFKYLRKIEKHYQKLENKDTYTYNKLKQSILDYRILLIKKFFEPIIEIENRATRFVIYLFSKQIINHSNVPYRSLYYNLFYFFILSKLRFINHFRKIRVGFWVTEPIKWAQQDFFEMLKNDKHFEPFILLSYHKSPLGTDIPKEYYNNSKQIYTKLNNKFYEVYNPNNHTFKSLSEFKPDIIFYQQPWQIPPEQSIEKNHKLALLCYIPYCFYSLVSNVNYLHRFHGVMWKYFVETKYHKKDYQKIFGATNCFVSGSVKLDCYKKIDKSITKSLWKTNDKKRIIYAPHHSFSDGMHEMATFNKNGKFILELAKSHPETEWVFRPHPAFVDRVLNNSIMSKKELENYYKEWERIGSISKGGNYYELFMTSDCLITDCISFLTEYATTGNPVLHLRKEKQNNMFNSFVSKIDETYYQIYDNAELKKVFDEVIMNNHDILAPQREKNKKILNMNTLASETIFNDLKKELWING